jgi:hypothetical protein
LLSSRGWTCLGLLVFLLAPESAKQALAQRSDRAQEPKPEAPADGRLGMSPAVACASIVGYERYVPLPEAVLSEDDKLLIYYCPLRYAIAPVGGVYQVHLVQDVRVRKRGDKTVIWSRDKLFEYKQETPEPPTFLYMFNRISLKGLATGDYDLDIILHDLHSKSPPAQQTLRFKVKQSASEPAPDPQGKREAAEEPAARA